MLRALVFYAYIAIINTALLCVTLWLALFGRKACLFAIWLWSKNASIAAKYILGIKYQVHGEIPKYPVIIASKHQSAWETMFFTSAIHDPVFVLKKELKWLPHLIFFIDRAGYIPIDRKRGMKEIRTMISKGRTALENGSPVVIFPEGTRKKPGDKPDYKPGAAVLYANLPEFDVIPVSLDSGKVWPRNSIRKYPGIITVTFHPPIEKGLSKSQFMQKLEEVIESA